MIIKNALLIIQSNKKRITIVFLLLLSVCLFFLFRPVFFSLTPQDEPFTELYFPEQASLPPTIRVGQPFRFSFTIHNQEGKTMQYPFVVFVSYDNKKEYIDRRESTLGQNQSVTISETLTPQVVTKGAQIVVTLNNLNQSIDFWVRVVQ
ncbi:MAG TPA: DUF1616 domain-containing protein [Patescibacteria group bacterium]|nr:DUF1616 domain-containing protein [Patescibacteria group bacterium]